jgi:hypothetical protein
MTVQARSPVEEAIDDLAADLEDGAAALNLDQAAAYPGVIAVTAGQKAVAALRKVLAAMADLEPGAALEIDDALRAGLGVTR